MPEQLAYKRPYSIIVAIYTPDGQTLILHRQAPARFWQSITGSVEQDETPIDAAAREISEETGLHIPSSSIRDHRITNRYPIPEKWAARYAPGERFNTEHVFSVSFPAPTPVRIDASEHSEAHWCNMLEAIDLVWSWTNKDLLSLLLTETGT